MSSSPARVQRGTSRSVSLRLHRLVELLHQSGGLGVPVRRQLGVQLPVVQEHFESTGATPCALNLEARVLGSDHGYEVLEEALPASGDSVLDLEGKACALLRQNCSSLDL